VERLRADPAHGPQSALLLATGAEQAVRRAEEAGLRRPGERAGRAERAPHPDGVPNHPGGEARTAEVAFADHGPLDGLRANIEAVLDEARATREFGRALAAEFLTGAPTFTERLHLGVLVWQFFDSWATQREAWARFALDWIDRWEDTRPTPDKLAAAQTWFEEVLAERAAGEHAR
jgi:hypothetical protein